jgi:hypothetical protein
MAIAKSLFENRMEGLLDFAKRETNVEAYFK